MTICYFVLVRKFTLFALFAAFFLAGCREIPFDDQIHREWRQVLEVKRAALDAPPERQADAKQAYVAALTDFLRTHPEYARAGLAYESVELEYARLLASRGRYDEAVVYYQSILDSNPENEDARSELIELERKRFVTADSFGALRRGMTQAQVEERLGRPLPGWSRSLVRGSTVTESWYYRSREGGVAGVFFRNGQLFAAEFDGPVRLGS